MSAFDRIAAALDAHGSNTKTTGANRLQAQCPAHEDRNPSLAVTGLEGQTLIHCHSGCHTEEVMAALDFTMADLFDDNRGVSYTYQDAAGTTLRMVTRTPDKKFRQSGDTKGTSTLYRLPQVLAAVAAGRPVYLVEGEKDVHALEAAGVTATTAPMGASNFTKVDATPLAGADIIAIVDRDEAGHRWAVDVRDTVTDKAKSITWCEAAQGKDAADHIAAGHTLDQLRPFASDDEAHARRMVLTPASAIKPRRVAWMWADRIALGTLALLAGGEGLGKSTLSAWVTARVTRGELPGEHLGTPKSVLICAAEDSWEHTIVPRLIAADADLDRVFRVEMRTADEITVGLSLPRDLLALEHAAIDSDASLLILDPLMSRISENLDTHKDGDVRRALEPLTAIADRANLAIVGLIHHNKSGSSDPLQLVMASKAFTAVARSVHSVMTDPDDDEGRRRLFGTPKNNLGRSDLPTLGFIVAGHAVPTDDGTAWTGQLQWTGEVDGTIAEAMRRAGTDPDDRSAASEAGAWLLDYLASKGGTAASADIKKHGAAAGHSQDALKRARRRHKLELEQVGFPRVTYWSLPGTQLEHQSEQTPRGDTPIALTAPTGEEQPQSARSEQSEQAPRTTAPTACTDCDQPLLLNDGRTICERCRLKAKEAS